MEIKIIAQNDECFKLEGIEPEVEIVETTPAPITEAPVTMVQPPVPKAMPLENSREGHPFDLFGGTSWAGKRQNFN